MKYLVQKVLIFQTFRHVRLSDATDVFTDQRFHFQLEAVVQQALDQSVDPGRIVIEGLTEAMSIVGEKFEAKEYFIPDMLASAETVGAAMDILAPHLARSGMASKGKVMMATVKGDLHDIGKNLVAMMLKGTGWKVVDLGVDVDAEKFVQSAIDESADVIGLSALLTTTMVNMKQVIEISKNKDCKSKVVVGGAPLTQNYANEIGADGYAPDAATATEVISQLAS